MHSFHKSEAKEVQLITILLTENVISISFLTQLLLLGGIL